MTLRLLKQIGPPAALAAALVAALAGAGGRGVAPAGAQASCQFILGFATLRDLIGLQTVGQCLEDQRFGPNGDAVQQTTGGLLVWRKADNWTAFTDGARTWINGPFGLAQRPNETRFPWEGDAISMQNNRFMPAEITVPAGTTLFWLNLDREPHDVIARDFTSFESPIFNPGETWSFTFNQPGRFPYFCDLHANMEGVVIVTE